MRTARFGFLPLLLMILSGCSDDSTNPQQTGGRNGTTGGATASGGSHATTGGSSGATGGTSAASGGDAGAGGEGDQVGVDAWHTRPGRGEVVDPGRYVAYESGAGAFTLVAGGAAAPIIMSSDDYAGVQRVAGDLKDDIQRVSDVEAEVVSDAVPSGAKEVVLLGTLGKSPLIDTLVSKGKLDVSNVRGRWETFLSQVVENPMDGVTRALVITGSDQRGTIYGAYDLSKQIGVSPWYYWDDVAPIKRSALYVLPGAHSQGEPAVKYRGFFVNDENPALGTWAPATFGPGLDPKFPNGFNHKYYAKVFELMLRLKANYLWPAVWGRAFAEDDPENHATAKAYGVVMGTSHEAPMMRGIEEWNRHAVAEVTDTNGTVTTAGSDPYGGNGLWRYSKNKTALEAYWRDGIKRMASEDFEGVVTLGMRGPGDVSLPVEDGIELMKQVVADERSILAEESGKPVTRIPQVWTLYKEVQDYWDQGMRAPDDVTIVWCDDNWGNMRELPAQSDPQRGGGYGIYYHFDYVGGGRNYKWVDTNLVPNIWEQLHLSYSYGVDRLWMVNVGDVKNEELPLEFFMDYAWNPERWPLERISDWEKQWATQKFGPDQGANIAEVLHTYSKLQSRRKPELTNRDITLDPKLDISDKSQTDTAVIYTDASPFSLTNYREFETMVAEWDELAARVAEIQKAMPAEQQDAYFELVGYQVQASADLYQHRLAAFKNILYATQGRASTNDLGAQAQEFFDKGTALASYYNETLAGGKWEGFQTQPYVGYGDVERYGSNASWQQPEKDNVALPDAIYPHLVDFTAPDGLDMGVAIDGSDLVWPDEASTATLPTFSPFQTQPPQYIEVFSRGTESFDYDIAIPSDAADWLTVTPNHGTIDDDEKEVRAVVSVDWDKAPAGATTVPLTVTGAGSTITVNAAIDKPALPSKFAGFVESNGYVAMEADHFSRVINAGSITWQRLPDIGRTGSGMTPFPVNAPTQPLSDSSARLEYDVNLFSDGDVTVLAYLSPRNDVLHGGGLKYAVSFDDETPVTVNVTTALNGIPMNRSWERNTSDNINLTSTKHSVAKAGSHVLKFWMIDPTVIVQKLVIDTGGVRKSYLGPPESFRKAAAP
jgi:hypothetical protein